jgi:hypothetical protein
MSSNSLDSMRKLKASLAKERRDREWPEAACEVCHSPFRYHYTWTPLPILCRSCRAERNTPYKSGEGDALYLET